MKALVIVTMFGMILLQVPVTTHAQILTDSITFVDKAMGYDLYQGPMKIGTNRIQALTKNCGVAWDNYHFGKQMESFGTMLIVCGLACGATAIGDYAFNEVPLNATPLVAAAVALVGLGIPIHRGGVKKVEFSTVLYNRRCARPDPIPHQP